MGQLPPDLQDKLDNGKASISVIASLFHPYIDSNKYRLGTEELTASFSTYYMRHRHPLTPKINGVLERLTHSGILLHIKERTLFSEGAISRNFDRSYKEDANDRIVKLTTGHLSTVWLLISVGIIIGIIAFILEIMKRKEVKKERDRALDYAELTIMEWPTTASNEIERARTSRPVLDRAKTTRIPSPVE